MKVLVVGDAPVSEDLLAEAAAKLSINEPFTITKLHWGSDSRQEFQKRALNIEKNGPSVEVPPSELVRELEDTDFLFVHFCPLSAETISHGKKLQLIGTCRGGLEHIDIQAATAARIPVFHVIRNAEATSDFAIGLMFAETRNIARGHAALKNGEWRKEYPNAAYTSAIKDLVLGVVGFGNIGKLVAKKCLGLGMTVLVHDPFVKQADIDKLGINAKLVSQSELFQTADIVSLHLRLTPETEGIINKDLLGLMKPSAYLINTSRAGVVKKEDLIEALHNRSIGGAALDVFWDEPLSSDDPILKLDNLTFTPHLAGNVVDALPKSPKLLIDTINLYWEKGFSDMLVNAKDLTSS